MLIAIAIVNAVLWSGVIIFLLLRTMRQQSDLDAQLLRMEAGLDKSSDTQNGGDA